MDTIICAMRPEEYDLLREFLYQAIYLPEGVKPPPRSVVNLPELQVYVQDFGTRPGDFCLAAEVEGKVVGAAWCRIMEDYGHLDNHPFSRHLTAAGIPRTGNRNTAAACAFAFAPGEWVPTGVPLCSERKFGSAPLSADGISHCG